MTVFVVFKDLYNCFEPNANITVCSTIELAKKELQNFIEERIKPGYDGDDDFFTIEEFSATIDDDYCVILEKEVVGYGENHVCTCRERLSTQNSQVDSTNNQH